MKTKTLIFAFFSLISLALKSQSLQVLVDTNVTIYDYIPDTVLTCNINQQDSLKIDINQDGIVDFKFYYIRNSGGCYPYVVNPNLNCWYYYFDDTRTDSLNGSGISWISGNNFWSPQTNAGMKFGIKIVIGLNNYYGWIRAVGGSFGGLPVIVDKYAFCKIPNYPFHLGQTEIITSVPNINAPDSTNVYLTNSGNNLHVQSGKLIKSVTITSANGVVVIFQDNLNSVSANVNVVGIAHGAYIVQVRFEDLSVYNKQIVR